MQAKYLLAISSDIPKYVRKLFVICHLNMYVFVIRNENQIQIK